MSESSKLTGASGIRGRDPETTWEKEKRKVRQIRRVLMRYGRSFVVLNAMIDLVLACSIYTHIHELVLAFQVLGVSLLASLRVPSPEAPLFHYHKMSGPVSDSVSFSTS